jgi:hypothetical protein
MTEQGDPLQETTTATPLRDFARARFYNYTVLQLVPHYIELRKAESRSLPRDTQNSLATSLHECIMNASMYAAIGQIADPNSVLSALLQHLLEQSNQGESSATYLPKHKVDVEALLNDIHRGTIALASALDARELDRQQERLMQDLRMMEYLSNLMD